MNPIDVIVGTAQEIPASVFPKRRPFMIIVHSHRPAKDEQGNLIEGKIEVVETAHLEDGVTRRHQDEASIIIDLLERKCIKRRFEEVQSVDEEPIIIGHYLSKYKEKVAQACQAYLANTVLTPEQDVLVRKAIKELDSST